MKKRIASSILCFAMLLSLLPVAGFATGSDTSKVSVTYASYTLTTDATEIKLPKGTAPTKIEVKLSDGQTDQTKISITKENATITGATAAVSSETLSLTGLPTTDVTEADKPIIVKYDSSEILKIHVVDPAVKASYPSQIANKLLNSDMAAPVTGAGTITLTNNVTLTKCLTVSQNQDITLDLNGKTLSSANNPYTIHVRGADTVSNQTALSTTAANVAKLTIVNSNATAGTISNTSNGSTVVNVDVNGSLTVGKQGDTDNTKIVIDRPSCNSTDGNSSIKSDEASEITIHSGTFRNEAPAARSIQSHGKTVINGGVFKGKVEAWKWQTFISQIEIKGGTFEDALGAFKNQSTEPGTITISADFDGTLPAQTVALRGEGPAVGNDGTYAYAAKYGTYGIGYTNGKLTVDEGKLLTILTEANTADKTALTHQVNSKNYLFAGLQFTKPADATHVAVVETLTAAPTADDKTALDTDGESVYNRNYIQYYGVAELTADGLTTLANNSYADYVVWYKGDEIVAINKLAVSRETTKKVVNPVALSAAKVTGTDKPFGEQYGAKTYNDLQGDITIATDNAAKKITLTGELKYVLGWTAYPKTATSNEQDGHFVAVNLATTVDGAKVFTAAPTTQAGYKDLGSGDTAVFRVENFANKTVTVKVGTAWDAANAETWTIDLSKLSLKPVAISSVAIDGGELEAAYRNDMIYLSGPVDFGSGDAAKDSVKQTVKITVAGVAYNHEVTITNGDKLTATADKFYGTDLVFNTDDLYAKKTVDAKPATSDPVVTELAPAANATNGEKAQITAANNALKAADPVTVDLTKAAAKAANDESMTKEQALTATGKDGVQTLPADTTAAEIIKITEAITEANKTSGGDTTKIDAVKLAVQVYMDVTVKEVKTTSTDANTATTDAITLTITPKAQKVLTTAANPSADGAIKLLTDENKTGDANAVTVGSPQNVTITTPTTVTVKLPATFAQVGDTVYVHHIKNGVTYIYKANEITTAGTVTFVSENGFSDFTFTKETPAAMIGNLGFETLQKAVDTVKDGQTIVLMKAGLTAEVNRAVSFAVMSTAGQTYTATFTAGSAVNAPTTSLNTDGNTVYTFTAKSSEDNNHGGGGGVSSNVTIDRPTNGKVSVTPTAPSKGATVTINLTPDTGYTVGTVTVTDKDGKAVELTKVNDTQYTFTMPDGRVTVKATFKQSEVTPPPATGFTDVAADAYYADAVKWAVDKGITNGLTATTFGPNNSCTRGQMVTFLWRAAGSPAATGTNSFSDVASGEYYYNAVLWAVEKGITNGTSATTFSPNATVNRGQTVTFLYRYAESPAATGDTSFTDVTADAFYADAVKWAVAEEITNGTSATTFSPASNCTRGQIVTFMFRQMAE